MRAALKVPPTTIDEATVVAITLPGSVTAPIRSEPAVIPVRFVIAGLINEFITAAPLL